MTTQLSTPELRELEYWQATAEKRIRLAWAALIVGIIIGCLLWAWITIEPAWVGELNCKPL